jgi:hypothetical protein
MKQPRDVFLISSPLQALVVYLLLSDSKLYRINSPIVFLEGSYALPPLNDVRMIRVSDTRARNATELKENAALIDNEIESPCNLWVSDLLWPMNNLAYSKLLAAEKISTLNFFDEGLVLYLKYKLSLATYFREVVKALILRARYSSYSIPARKPFSDNFLNGRILAIHPELIGLDSGVERLEIDVTKVRDFSRLSGDSINQSKIAQASSPLLFLSQPYHRFSSASEFGGMMKDLVKYLEKSGFTELFIKLHPSESLDDFRKYYSAFGFSKVLEDMRSPIEANVMNLSSTSTLLTFNSSALLNVKRFGFKGNLISYGLDWVEKKFPYQRKVFIRQDELFRHVGAEVISAL